MIQESIQLFQGTLLGWTGPAARSQQETALLLAGKIVGIQSELS